MDAVVRRLSDPAARRELARRIESGSGFDDIARLAGWDGIYLTSLHCPEDHPFLGKSLAQIAALTGQDPLDCCCDLLVREDGQITMIDFMASEEDIIAILQSDLSNLISDSTYPTEGMPHPRVYGTFPRLIQHFVMKKHALTLEQAVRKMTALPARASSRRGWTRTSASLIPRSCGKTAITGVPAGWRPDWTPCWWRGSRRSYTIHSPAHTPVRSSGGNSYENRYAASVGGRRPPRRRHRPRGS